MSHEMVLHKQQTNLSRVRMKKIAQSRSEYKITKALLITGNISVAVTLFCLHSLILVDV